MKNFFALQISAILLLGLFIRGLPVERTNNAIVDERKLSKVQRLSLHNSYYDAQRKFLRDQMSKQKIDADPEIENLLQLRYLYFM